MRKLFLLAAASISIVLLAGCGAQASQGAAGGQTTVSKSISRQPQDRDDASAVAASSGKQATAEKVESTPAEASPSAQEQPKNSGDIGEEQAAAIALADAGVQEADTSYLRVHLDRDDGFVFYEVDFASQGTEYDYEIQISDGAILKAERDRDDDSYRYQNSGGNTDSSGNSGLAQPAVSFEEAKALALGRVSGAADRNLQMELEYDDGILHYEGEIHYNGMEYEFEIRADNGEFLKWQEEFHD